MESKSKFDLSDAIQKWRDALAQSAPLSEEDLNELEHHLHDSMAQLRLRQLSDEESFLIASRRLGSEDLLNREFSKIHRARIGEPWLRWMLFGILLYPFASGLEHMTHLVTRSASRVILNGHVLGLLALAVDWLVVIAISAMVVWIMREKRGFGKRWVQRWIDNPFLCAFYLVVVLLMIRISFNLAGSLFRETSNLSSAEQSRFIAASMWIGLFTPTNLLFYGIPIFLIHLACENKKEQQRFLKQSDDRVKKNRSVPKRISVFLAAVIVISVAYTIFFILPPLNRRARMAQTKIILDQVAIASKQYYAEYGVWPHSLSELTHSHNPRKIRFLEAPSTGVTDGWGKPITYIQYDGSEGSGKARSGGYEVGFAP